MSSVHPRTTSFQVSRQEINLVALNRRQFEQPSSELTWAHVTITKTWSYTLERCAPTSVQRGYTDDIIQTPRKTTYGAVAKNNNSRGFAREDRSPENTASPVTSSSTGAVSTGRKNDLGIFEKTRRSLENTANPVRTSSEGAASTGRLTIGCNASHTVHRGEAIL
ncbi:hypothetical protein QAD02_000044 [Eretmocerus hayati]|uniref:Uncharacterized protein n=1 Tax=Eretmocerus hayati TaxID=131215 RepID=A0ACC2NCB4_9HYME|nr:hypothetical protein QAD02_000044 [Eretmocerus hayati]